MEAIQVECLLTWPRENKVYLDRDKKSDDFVQLWRLQ